MYAYIAPFWFATFVNEYKPEFNSEKIRKIEFIGHVYIHGQK